MEKLKACGVLVLRQEPTPSFLLLRHPHRYDLPKGHLEGAETELECALRELYEETGIAAHEIAIDPDFRYEETYYPRYRRFNGARVEKTLVVFLAELHPKHQHRIVLAEHEGFEWVPWQPPHRVQRTTVDPLLKAVEAHLGQARPKTATSA